MFRGRKKNQKKMGKKKKAGAGPRPTVWSKMEKMGVGEEKRNGEKIKSVAPCESSWREAGKEKKNPAKNGDPGGLSFGIGGCVWEDPEEEKRGKRKKKLKKWRGDCSWEMRE